MKLRNSMLVSKEKRNYHGQIFYPKHTLELQEGIIPDQNERLECGYTPPCSDVNFLNDLSRGLNVNNSQFDVMLGEGAKAEVADIIHEQSNMGGRDPDMEKKVGLLDRHHLMCFLVDLHGYEWGSTFLIYTNIAVWGGAELYIPFGKRMAHPSHVKGSQKSS